MSPLDQLYGSNQSYTNPNWMSQGNQYGGFGAQTNGIENAYVGQTYNPGGSKMGGGNPMMDPYGMQRATIQGGMPPDRTGAMTGSNQPPMASQPGIDESRLYNGNLDPSTPPIFRLSDIQASQGQRNLSNGDAQDNIYTPGSLSLSGGGNNPRSDTYGLNPLGDINGWTPQQGFQFTIKSGANQGNQFDYKIDPTGQYYVPGAGRVASMPHGQAYGTDVWSPIALLAGGYLGGSYLGAAAGAGEAAGAGAEALAAADAAGGLVPAYGTTSAYEAGLAGAGAAGGGAGTGADLINGGLGNGLGGSAPEGALETAGTQPAYGGTGSSAATGGGEIGGQTGYAQGTESLFGNAGQTSNMSLKDLYQYYQAGSGAVNAANGGGGSNGSQQQRPSNNGGSMTNPDGSINWANLIGNLGSAWYSQNRMNNYGGDLQGMFTRMENNAAPFLNRLSESYSNPDSYLKGPEYQALQGLEEDRLNRRAGASGRLGNDIDRDVLLQKYAQQQLGQYRQGLQSSVDSLYGNAARYAPLYQAGSTARNASGAPLFGMMGQGNTGNGQGGGIPWSQLWNAGSGAWDQYGSAIGDWLGGLFSG